MLEHYDILIIGGGAAGMAAAVAAANNGIGKILLVERNPALGGVLKQCLHHGFGLGYFAEDITGVEYAERFEKMLVQTKVQVMTDTMVMRLNSDRTAELASAGRLLRVSFDKCILATGCREQTIYSLPVGGTRPAGIFTAGTAQKLTNIYNYDIGDNILILGTGDIGQIMARRFRINGKNVIAMVEQKDHPGGMQRNIRNCIEAYNIPVILNSTVVEVFGEGRITGVNIRRFDTGEVEFIACDTLVTALGLIPERELITDLLKKYNAKLETSDTSHTLQCGPEKAPAAKKINLVNNIPDWLRICGNADYVHDIVDSVTAQAMKMMDNILN